MLDKLEIIDCPICNNRDFIPLDKRQDGLVIVRCKTCGLACLNPRPILSELSTLYSNDYYLRGTESRVGYAGYKLTLWETLHYPPFGWELILEHISLMDKRTLDIGCAFGRMVAWCSRAGARATGIDLISSGVEWGRRKLGLDLRQMSIEEFAHSTERFDMITLIDVLEHFANPAAILNDISKLVRPGGIIFIQTPNFGTYSRQKVESIHLRTSLEHLTYFEKGTLDRILVENGWQLIRPTEVYTLMPDKSEQELRGLKRYSFLKNFLGKSILRKFYRRICPFKNVYDLDPSGQYGSALVVCAKRKEGF